MKKTILASLAIVLACAAVTAPALADTLYTSGASTYDLQGYTICCGLSISDSFDPTESGTATSVQFVAWLDPSTSLTSVEWSIETTLLYSSNLESGTAYPSASFIETNQDGLYVYDVYSETFSIPSLSLTTGDTYYLTLKNAVATPNNIVSWDENGNFNTGYVPPSSIRISDPRPSRS
jgi:hypothetical protein